MKLFVRGERIRRRRATTLGVMALAVACAGQLSAQSARSDASSTSPSPRPVSRVNLQRDGSAIASRSIFFVGGTYAADATPGRVRSPQLEGGAAPKVMRDQMYVEKLTPFRPRRPYPIILIHGGSATATYWTDTPDGREGWAQYFVAQGFVVYLVDQPARGRSAWHEGLDGKLHVVGAEAIERLFTQPEAFKLWPQAKLHTQFPDGGLGHSRIGDPIFDQFYASIVPYLSNNAETQRLSRDAVAALLDRTGPAVLVTHSDSGPIGWLIADVRPNLVKGIIAVEPGGPPFHYPSESPFGDVLGGNDKLRPWGLTDIPITYAPAVTDAAPLQYEQQAAPDRPGLTRCWQEKGPAHQLVNLKNVRVMLIAGEASYHAMFDQCTSRFLNRAGVKTDLVNLENFGIHGNAHMMMIEKNNRDIAALITSWLGKNIR